MVLLSSLMLSILAAAVPASPDKVIPCKPATAAIVVSVPSPWCRPLAASGTRYLVCRYFEPLRIV